MKKKRKYGFNAIRAGVVLGLLIAAIAISAIALFPDILYQRNSVEYYPKSLDFVKPELMNGVNSIYFYEEYIDVRESNDSIFFTYGRYNWPFSIIKVSLKRGNHQETLCHELLHHEWNTILSREEKEFWRKEYLKFKDEFGEEVALEYFYTNENEFRAYALESFWESCYTENVYKPD